MSSLAFRKNDSFCLCNISLFEARTIYFKFTNRLLSIDKTGAHVMVHIHVSIVTPSMKINKFVFI